MRSKLHHDATNPQKSVVLQNYSKHIFLDDSSPPNNTGDEPGAVQRILPGARE